VAWRPRPRAGGAPGSAELGYPPVPSGAGSASLTCRTDPTAAVMAAAGPAGARAAGAAPAEDAPAAAAAAEDAPAAPGPAARAVRIHRGRGARAANSGSRTVRPSPESGPTPATCLPGCAWRAISLPGSTLGAALRHRGRPPIPSIECRRIHPGRYLTGARMAKTAEGHSERCCGIPASSARTSVSLYRRCPPSVRIEVSLPAFAHRVTVLGSTRNIVATSAGVNSGSASGVRADMCCGLSSWTSVAILRSCTSWCSVGSESGMSIYGRQGPYCHHQR